jgi:nitroreductase
VELTEAMRTAGATRDFAERPVSDEVVFGILDVARFARSGGSRPVWRVIVVKDPQRRRRLRDLFRHGSREYQALKESGLVAWAPITDREREAGVLAGASQLPAGEFAEHLDEVPVLLIVLADLRELAAMDRDNGRYTFVGGATVYPFAWNVMLAARDQGLVGVLTTLFSRTEPEAREALGIPEEFAIAAAIALGHPVAEPAEPARAEVEQFTSIDELFGPAFTIKPARTRLGRASS